MMKRIFDLAVAVPAALATAPLVAGLAAAVKLTSPGPAFFAQTRVGRGRKPIRVLKLRTMVDGADRKGPAVTAGGDARITPLGALLRKTKLDELPQLWNVAAGEMSLVGPRPCLPAQRELIDERQRRGVLRLRPGLTGLAQVNGIDMSDPVRLAEKDAEYLARSSLTLDLRIILATLTGHSV
jgi:O-antigen biosynthesis protein WbqP